ncbi:MAG: DNA polymerase III subunit alpha [Candidatus Eisenbacteria bacterium]|nr:DNA polymerase III subunit alpha [Candidatus Eisenbacteria bacterium]
MKHADFVHLHNHSDYSLLDGASPIPGMVKRAAELRMPALALTDHGSLFGAVEFYQEARKAGVKPIVGIEAYVTRGRRQERTRETAHHLVLLARDEAGFRNLMRLSSLAFLEGFYYKPRVDHEVLAQHGQGLLALSACPKGEVASDLLAGDEESAARTALMYRDIFGAENYFLEIQNHGLEIETKIRERIRALSSRTGIPIVATNDCHYLAPDHVEAQDILICIQTGKTVSDANRMRAVAELHFRSPEEMRAAFPDFPEALANTLAVAERCNLEMKFGKPLLPAFPLPQGETSAEEYLRGLAWSELRTRFDHISDEVKQRFDYELDVICRMGFAPYFLIVRDFIAFARSKGIGVGPGRGSVAGSLVAYALHITDIDPLQHGLIFERFLNPERVTMPDIDIDFDDLRRGEVIEYVKQKYGEQCVTQIITFGTMGALGVMRDVGRALGLPVPEIDRIAKMVPEGIAMTLEKALEQSPDLRNLPQRGETHARLLKTARTLEGLARHASTHAAGVLITPGPLVDYVPLYRQKDESVTTQWDMKSVEKAGLLKMDFLGLRTLSVLEETVRLVALRTGARLDLAKLPTDDEATYRIFQGAETVAIFQFESSPMRDHLRKLRPTVFDDLVAMNALYRPGPMENIPTFIECKHGRIVLRYEHPDLEPILKSTYGVFVYQEQVMAATHRLAGFSLAQADEMRRAMAKKLPEEMEAKEKAFVEGCVKNRIPAAKAERIFEAMVKFAGYGFNRCLVGGTELIDAVSGERATIGELFRAPRPFTVHALGGDWKLHPRSVTDVVWNGRKPVFELLTAQGKRITATANHPFRTLDGWKNLEDLKPGDRIAAPRRLEVAVTRSWPRHELITLAGLLAEGNTCHPTTLYYFNRDRLLIDDFAAAISNFPDTVTRLYERRNGALQVSANLGLPGRVKDESVYGYEATEGNLALVMDVPDRRSGAFRWAERLGILGCRATEKFIPEEVFELRDSDLEVFMGRLWAGDGFIACERRFVPFYATSSERLARDVQTVLLRLGILAGLHRKEFKYRGTTKTGYTVDLLGEGSLEAFVERIAPHVIGREGQVGLLRARLVSVERGQCSRDTVPRTVSRWVDEERKRVGLRWRELGTLSQVSIREFTGQGSARKRGFRRSTLMRLARFFGSLRLARIAESDVFWDRVVSIESRGIQDTYDLTVEKDHSFVADGIIVHNSHSAAYALLAYQCAYLKAHWPAEFMAATLTSEMSDSSRIVTLVEECRRMKLEVLPPDVNRSDWKFSLEEGKIRMGLGAVRNVGQAAIESLVAARAGTGGAPAGAPGEARAGAAAADESGSRGPFRDLFDLACRVDTRALNRRALECLIAAGACDVLGAGRERMFAGAGRALEHAASLHRERQSGQSSLFGAPGHGGGVVVAVPELPPAEAWTSRDRSAREKEVLGFYFSEHPLEPLREQLARLATHGVGEALGLEPGTEVRLAGLVGEVRSITTRAGKLMGVMTLEDLSGRVECTMFQEQYAGVRAWLAGEEIVVVSGRVEDRDDRGPRVLVSEIKRFEEARTAYRPCLHVEVRADELSVSWLEQVDQVLSAYPGEAEVFLHIIMPDHSRRASRSRRYRVAEDAAVVPALKERFPGVRALWGKGMS